jgi:hypothetical protein
MAVMVVKVVVATVAETITELQTEQQILAAVEVVEHILAAHQVVRV